eukprot:14703-Heterococcus_DN1.PRE.2
MGSQNPPLQDGLSMTFVTACRFIWGDHVPIKSTGVSASTLTLRRTVGLRTALSALPPSQESCKSER